MHALHAAGLDVSAHDDSARLYRLIADTIPHMVWTARADGALDYFNRRCHEYTGLDSAQLGGWSWKAVIHPDDWERCLAAWTRCLQSGERYDIEYRLRRHDGVYRWHHGVAVPTRGADGRLARWFGTCTDIEHQFRSAQMLEEMVQQRARALQDTERRLQGIIDNEPECVKLLDAEGRLLEMNPAGLRMIEADGIGPILGQCVYPLVAEPHRAAFRALTERVCRGERGTLEFEIVGLKGTRRWLETQAVPFEDVANGCTCLLGITRDITDRRRAEQALRESERRFQLFMDHLPAPAWIRDADFRYLYVNAVHARSRGLEPAELLGRDAAQFSDAADAERFREVDREVIAGGRDVRFRDHERDADWLKIKFPVALPGGGTGVGGVAIDMTEQVRLEEALRESERRFQAFMDHVPVQAWIRNVAGQFIYVNREYAETNRVQPEQMIGRTLHEFFPASTVASFLARDREVLDKGESIQFIDELPRGHWLKVKFPLPLPGGETGIAGISLDITERIEAERLARLYAERVRDMIGRLIDAQELERRRLSDDLHDLIGQNLTALGLELAALRAGLPQEAAAKVAPRGEAMAGLLDDTIEAIRGVMTELRPPALEEYGLIPALRWYAGVFEQRTGLKVRADALHANPRLQRDVELALFRIVQEALTNAAKHSGGSAVEIAVTEAEGMVRVVIQDDGRGFVDPVGARSAGRGGWGLPTMRERAEAHGGSLRIEFPGRGTRLVVEVPRRDDY